MSVFASLPSVIAPSGFYSIDFKIDVLHRCKERELRPRLPPPGHRAAGFIKSIVYS